MLDVVTAEAIVAIAVDAAGAAGLRPFSYRVPERLADLAPGEAVLVEFGRRQALGIVLGPGAEVEGVETKPILDRVRADGPLLPELGMRLAGWIAEHYLAPPAITLRAMLPPGLLERLELVAELRPAAEATADPSDGFSSEDLALLESLAAGPRPVRPLDAPEGRPTLLRRLRALEAGGRVDLDWTLLAAGAGPRWIRFVQLAAPPETAATGTTSTKRLGPRQRALLAELEAGPSDGVSAPELAARHGSSTIAGLVRRGLVTVDVREAPRRPLELRAAGRRGTRPAGAVLSPEQVAAVDAVDRAAEAGSHQVILLDGVTGGGKTAIYGELLERTLARGRPGLVLVPEIALALPLVDRLRADLDARVAMVHSALSDGERADEWRRIRRGEVDVVVGTRSPSSRRSPTSGSSWSTRSTTRRTRAIGHRGSRRATRRSSWAGWQAPPSSSARQRRRSRRRARPARVRSSGSGCRFA